MSKISLLATVSHIDITHVLNFATHITKIKNRIFFDLLQATAATNKPFECLFINKVECSNYYNSKKTYK